MYVIGCLLLLFMCLVLIVDFNKDKCVDWCFKMYNKEKVIPVFIVPKIEKGKNPVLVHPILPNHV